MDFSQGVSLHPVDIAMLFVYAVGMVGVGLWFSRRTKGAGGDDAAADYFLAGRAMLWPVIGFSLFASNISSTTLIGLAGDAYGKGIWVFNYEWMAAFVLAFFAIFVLPQILRSGVFTMPEFLERRFGRGARLYFAGLTLFLNIVVDTAASLFAGAVVMKLVFPGVETWQIVAVLAVLAGIYTIVGGLSAVMITDVLQAVLLLLGAIVITVIAFAQIGGWSAIAEGVPAEKLSLIRPADDEGMPWPALITGVSLLGFYFWGTNQFMAQRFLAAKDANHARWGAILAGFLKLPVLLIMVLPGTMAILIYGDGVATNQVYPTLMFDLLPVGLLGLVLAGFFAALMSQIDSTLNSASTMVTMDFVRSARPDLSQERLSLIGKVATFVFMLAAVAWAPQIERFESIFVYLQQVLAYTVGPICAVYLVGTFWPRANRQGANAGLIVGTILGVVLLVGQGVGPGVVSTAAALQAEGEPVPGILASLRDLSVAVFGDGGALIDWSYWHWLYAAPSSAVVTALVIWVVSLRSPAPDREVIAPLVWTPAVWRGDAKDLATLPWYANYRYQFAALIGVTTVILIAFW